jgi:hypothetical protein
MNIMSFLMPAAKSPEAGAKTHGPADAQAGTGFAAMLAQVLGSLGVPVRSEATPGAGASAAPAEEGATPSPASGEAAEAAAASDPEALTASRSQAAPVEDSVTNGACALVTSPTNGQGTRDHSVTPAGSEHATATLLGEVRLPEAQPVQRPDPAPAAHSQARVAPDGRTPDTWRSDTAATTAASMPAVGSLLRGSKGANDAGQRHAGVDRQPLGDAPVHADRAPADAGRQIVHGPEPVVAPSDHSVRARSTVGYDAPSLMVRGHTIESMTYGASQDAAAPRPVSTTPGAAAKKLMQMIVEPPVASDSKPGEAEAVAPARTDAQPRVMPMVEPPVPRMMNAPAGSGEAPMVRGAPEVPQQPDAPKGGFDSVSLRVDNADGTPTRIRVAVRGDEVRTTIIENDAGAAQRMVSRGDELQQSLAARGFSKATVSVHSPAGRAPEGAVPTPMHVDRSDAGGSSDGRADRDGDRASNRDQMHERPDRDREQSRSRQRSPRERER